MNTSSAIESVSVSTLSPVLAPIVSIKLDPLPQETVDAFCFAILTGSPTRNLLPGTISELFDAGRLTNQHKAQIKQARKDHELGAEANRAVLFALAKRLTLKGAKFNKDNVLSSLRFTAK